MDEDYEYYQNFLASLRGEGELPSDDEDFLATEEAADYDYTAKVPKTELVDLVLESESQCRPIRTVYRPVLPVPSYKAMSMLVFLTKEQRMLLLNQIEMYIQLLLQTILLAPEEQKKEAVLLFQTLPIDNTKTYDVSFLLQSRIKIQLTRQVSVIQVPLLQAIRSCTNLQQLMHCRPTRKEVRDALNALAPAFINSSLLPLEKPPPPRKIKHGFTILDDMLLLQGLMVSKSPAWLHEHWLPSKSTLQIKNRIKNLKSKKYAPKNEAQARIMRILELRREPLSDEELHQLRRGLQWFGTQRLELIRKYLLPLRTLKQVIEASEKQLHSPSLSYTQENLCGNESCECFCTCGDAYEVYYLP